MGGGHWNDGKVRKNVAKGVGGVLDLKKNLLQHIFQYIQVGNIFGILYRRVLFHIIDMYLNCVRYRE